MVTLKWCLLVAYIISTVCCETPQKDPIDPHDVDGRLNSKNVESTKQKDKNPSSKMIENNDQIEQPKNQTWRMIF